MNKQIVYIPVDQLYPHPDNPRKDLGDLSELTKSIKVNGVLQNLTVIPGHRMTSLEWQELERQYRENPTEEVRCKMNSRKCEDGYTVIIGHRRLAASQLAGLTELPCAITEMTPQEQLKTMMVENMQRSDLTVYEQAQGFQLMLDMGETVESISKDSGFSVSTIRRRVKLLELDQEKFRKAEARGATLSDYLELDKIEDPALKNKVLDAIGTPNFQNELKTAVANDQLRRKLEEWEPQIAQYAQKIEKRGEVDGERVPMDWVAYFDKYNKDRKADRPADAGEVRYFYVIRSGVDITLYKEHLENEREKTAEEIAHAERKVESERIRAELQEITERHFNLRNEFVSGLSQSAVKKHFADIAAFAMRVIIGDGMYCRDMPEPEALNLCFDLDFEDDVDFDDLHKILEPKMQEAPEKGILFCVYAMADDGAECYYHSHWSNARQVTEYMYEPNDELDRIYDLLVKLGYEISDEEKEMMNGTHALLAPLEDE